MSPRTRGALIVIEGIDRSGKSTQCELLKTALNSRGHVTNLIKFPDRTTAIGQLIDSYLKKKCKFDDHAIHLLFSANRWEASDGMKKDLLNGVNLIVDRYAYSGVAYSAGKKGMDFDWCKNSDVGLPEPDVVMFLNLTAEEAQHRSGYGEEIYENKIIQTKVLQIFDSLKKSGNWINVDASGTIKDVNKVMCDVAENTIKKAKQMDIKKLWVQ